MHRPLAILMTLTAALALSACGSSSSTSTSKPASSAPSSTASSGQTASPGGSASSSSGVSVKMVTITFSPAASTVKVGQKVTWTNNDSVTHNVTATSGATFKSSDFGAGGTFSYTPTRPGPIAYRCTIHPSMTATLKVVR